MIENNICNVAFLGVCDRASNITQGHSSTWHFNILRLKPAVQCFVFPISLKKLNFLFAIYDPNNFKGALIRLINQNGLEIMNTKIEVGKKAEEDTNLSAIQNPIETGLIPINCGPPNCKIWSPIICNIDKDVIIQEQGRYLIVLDEMEKQTQIGYIDFMYVPCKKYTKEQIDALKANPQTFKIIRIFISCNNCSKKITVYTSFEKDKNEEELGHIWYENLEDSFICDCNKTKMDLKYIKENMHALLGNSNKGYTISSISLYEYDALSNVYEDFRKILERSTEEEEIQKYIEKNPIILHKFLPAKLFYKAPILTKYKTDFVVLDDKKQLILIEIEKSNTSIMKKNGGLHAELQSAFDQVNNWLSAAEEERSAVITCIGLKSDEVGSFRGVVIAGRDKDYDLDKLRRIKGRDYGKIEFYTYDDILNGCYRLLNEMKKINYQTQGESP